MGKITGFLDYEREDNVAIKPLVRIKNFDEFYFPLDKLKRKEQAARCMDCGIPFCQYGKELQGMTSGCPLNNLVPEFNDNLYHGNLKEALNRLLKTSSMPEFTARVCPALCEKACTCEINGESVATKANEFEIIEFGFENDLIKPDIITNRLDQKIAIIGSGPCGLEVANSLNRRGYNVDIYERDDRFGGLLMYGIPNMKLDKNIVDRRIDIMIKSGINFFPNQNINTKAKAKKIIDEYDKVVLAVGSKQARDVKAPNRDGNNILFAVDYLTDVTKSLLNSELEDKKFANTKHKNVVVIGGGDTGNDCVGTSIRLGCKSVVQLELMPQPPLKRDVNNPWPTWPKTFKVDYGQEESLALFNKDPRVYQTTVKEFVLDANKNIKSIKTVKVEFVTEDGKRLLKEIEGSEKDLPCDLCLIAAGFIGVENDVVKAFDLKVTSRNVVECDDFQTSNSKVYAAGDVRRGQSLVVWAMKEGRDVAAKVDKDLMGYTSIQ